LFTHKDTAVSSRRTESLESSFAAFGLFGFLVSTALWWGAAQRAAVIVTSFVLLIVGVLSWRAAVRVSSPLFWPLLMCGLWTLLAVVPTPITVLEILSPQASDLWNNSLQVMGTPAPRWASISIDPGATFLEGLKWCSYALVAWLAATVTRARGLNFVFSCIFLVALILALASLMVAVFHGDLAWLAGGTDSKIKPIQSLLINPNNLSGYLNLGGFCGLGLVASRRPPVPKATIVVGVCVVLASSVWSGSRAGVAVLFLSLAVLTLWWMPRWVREQERTSQARAALGASLVLGIPGLAWLGASTALYRDLLSDDLSKFGLLPRVVPAVRDYWLLGTGRGGFESVSQVYLPSSSNIVFRYIENFIASWVVEWGVPFSTFLIVGLAYVLRPRFLCLARGAPAQAAFLGVVAVLLQNLMDLGLELFSLTAAVVATLAALLASRGSRGGSSPWPFPRKVLAASAGAGIALLGIVGASVTGPDGYKARQQLEAHWASLSRDATTLPQLTPQLERNVLRRPADPYPFIIGAVAAWEGNHRILPWAAAALDRAPTNGRVHLLVALGLAQLGASQQALLHLVQTVEFNPALLSKAAILASQLSAEPKFFVDGVSSNAAGAQLLVALAGQWSRVEQRGERRLIAERALAIAPDQKEALALLASDLLRDVAEAKRSCVGSQTPACQHLTQSLDASFQRIEQLAERLAHEDRCRAVQIRARRFAVNREAERALAVLDGCSACESPSPCLQAAASIAQDVDATTRSQLEQQYVAAACGQDESCGRAEAWVGQLAEKRGDWLKAHVQYVRAADVAQKGEYWLAAARAALRAGRLGDAERAYQQAVSLGAPDAQVRAAVEKLKKESLPTFLLP
jgi:tetratricopeptide (TPR) repeat protein